MRRPTPCSTTQKRRSWERGRSLREVEAESVAYVVCQHFGLDTGEYSFGYVAGWSQDRELGGTAAVPLHHPGHRRRAH